MQGFAAELIGEVLTHGKGPLGQLVRILYRPHPVLSLLPFMHLCCQSCTVQLVIEKGTTLAHMAWRASLHAGLPRDRAPGCGSDWACSLGGLLPGGCDRVRRSNKPAAYMQT